MLLNFYASYKIDKQIDHPLLGSLSCSGMKDAYQKCHELIAQKNQIKSNCKSLYLVSYNCYTKKNNKDFLDWIDKEINEYRRLINHLKKNKSILPDLYQQNMISDLFFNIINQERKIGTAEEINFKENYLNLTKEDAGIINNNN